MKTVIYTRISKGGQNPRNQLIQLKELAKALKLEVVKEYSDTASGGSANRPQFQEMLADAKKGKFKMILIWSLDRFSREGIRNTLSYLEILKKSGVGIRSLKESWLDTSDEGMGELLLAIFSWIAKEERKTIVARTLAGLKRAKLAGKKIGRPNGSKDKVRRKRSGYLLRWVNS